MWHGVCFDCGMMKNRFNRFKLALAGELGNRATLTEDGQVIVWADEFNETKTFRSLQRAIDHFARFMPESLKQF